MASIAEELAKLTNPNPSFDPEDNNVDDTAAKLVDKHDLDPQQDDNTQSRLQTLRLEVKDTKYEGEVVSRKDLEDSDFHSSENDFEMEISDRLSELSENEISVANDDVKDNLNDFMDEEIDSDEAMGSSDEEKFAPGIFSKKQDTPIHKSADTKNQIQLWENLLETRIRVQKLLMFANQLPQYDSYQSFIDEEEINPLLKSTMNAQENLLASLFNLQSKLLEQNKETKDLSHSEESEDGDWNKKINNRQTILRTHRNKILAHWYDKTRLGSGKITKKQTFTNFERPTIETIEHILKDQKRLVQRTQIKRSEYKVIGKSFASETEDNEEMEHNAHLKQGGEETFDDDDFYQHLLRQFIEQKSATVTTNASSDSIEMTRQWLKHQRLKTKVKKNVDTKASKGRKIRYHIHPKLMSFMAPSTEGTWTDESKDQLVKSMFGKNLS